MRATGVRGLLIYGSGLQVQPLDGDQRRQVPDNMLSDIEPRSPAKRRCGALFSKVLDRDTRNRFSYPSLIA